MLSHAHKAGAARALQQLGLAKAANAPVIPPKGSNELLLAARRNPVMSGLALGGAIGLGMGVNKLTSPSPASAPQPQMAYNYAGPQPR